MSQNLAPIPFKPHRFQSAAPHYLAGRPYYARALIDRVAELCRLTTGDRLLDLGCGPGQLALAFAPLAAAVIGIDPEPEMLKIATAAAGASPNVSFREGSSYDLGPDLGTFRLVVIGRAFHWMDRPATLHSLDAIVEPSGAIVLFSEKHPTVPDNEWTEAYRVLVERYTEGGGTEARWQGPAWRNHEAVLLDSGFSALERISIIERRRTPSERFIDRALSRSRTSPERLGEKAAALAQDVLKLMQDVAHDGLVTEVVESIALIARRPESQDL